MAKYSVTVKGNLYFERTLTVISDNENNAKDIAIEMLIDSANGDDFDVENVEIKPFKESSYEIGLRIKNE